MSDLIEEDFENPDKKIEEILIIVSIQHLINSLNK
jgi:hypothetical protein